MAYNTQQDMVNRFSEAEMIELTDDAGDGVINATVLAQAIDDATAEIDGYLAGRYSLPLAFTPQILVLYACDITRYRLYDDAVTDQVTKRYEDAISFLKLAAQGKVSFGPNTDGDTPGPAGSAQMESGGRIFGRDQGGFL